jgi:hypothetical protein
VIVGDSLNGRSPAHGLKENGIPIYLPEGGK